MTTSKDKDQDDVAVVVRGDGKEFTIKRSMVAEHINRGFKVKDAKDQPTEEELKKAVGFDLKKPADTVKVKTVEHPAFKAETQPYGIKPIAEWTVPQLQEEAARLGLNVPKSAKKADLVKLISAAAEFGSHDSDDDETSEAPEVA